MSDFVGDVDSAPDETSLPSGVHIDMPDFADSDGVLQVSDYVNFGEPRSGATSPESGSMTAMSDFVSDVDPGPGGPLQGSAVIFDRQNLVSSCEQNKCRRGTVCIPYVWSMGRPPRIPVIKSLIKASVMAVAV